MELQFNNENPTNNNGVWSFAITYGDSVHVHSIVYGQTRDEAERNANLVVAGPRLLAALQMAYEDWGKDTWSDKRQQITEAIGLAHGRK